jgi:hypothetical protein
VLRPERFVRGEPPILYRFLWPSTVASKYFFALLPLSQPSNQCVSSEGDELYRRQANL